MRGTCCYVLIFWDAVHSKLCHQERYVSTIYIRKRVDLKLRDLVCLTYIRLYDNGKVHMQCVIHLLYECVTPQT